MSDDTFKRYHLLDAFRGLAIIWIVLFHVLVDMRGHYGPLFSYIVGQGYLGVPLFFVISGYSVAASISNNALYLRQPHLFLLRRLRRIYFCYWWHLLFAAVIIPCILALISMIKTHSFSVDWFRYSMFEWLEILTLTKVFSASSWYLPDSFQPLNAALWYVAIIVQVYCFVSICLYFRKHYVLLLFIGFIASLVSYIPLVKTTLPHGLFLPYFSKFYIGVVVHALLRNNLVPKSWLVKTAIFLFLSAVSYYFALTDHRLFSLSFAGFAGFMLLILHKYDYKISGWFVVRIFYVLGIFSYSLYLLHAPLQRLLGVFVRHLIPISPELSAPIILIPGIIVLSFFWYLFFERPATQREVFERLTAPVDTIISGISSLNRIFGPPHKSTRSVNLR